MKIVTCSPTLIKSEVKPEVKTESRFLVIIFKITYCGRKMR